MTFVKTAPELCAPWYLTHWQRDWRDMRYAPTAWHRLQATFVQAPILALGDSLAVVIHDLSALDA